METEVTLKVTSIITLFHWMLTDKVDPKVWQDLDQQIAEGLIEIHDARKEITSDTQR